MRGALQAVVEELRRLKADGERTIPVSDEALAELRRVAALAVAEATAADDVCGVAEPSMPYLRAIAETPEGGAPVRPRTVRADPVPAALPPPPALALPAGDKRTRWDALLAAVRSDPVCQAHVRPGKQVVLGVGDLDAKIFFCGEAPGAEEEVQGEPFVGPAGQLLTKMIQAMGLRRDQVYIGNIMNWRPELPTSPGGEQYGNRPPTPEEMNYCLPYLKAQLEIVQPTLIVALGATAAGGLLGQGTFRTLGEIRGRWREFEGRPVMVTYHPSYILRNQSNRSKRAIWEDLLLVMERAGLPISERQRSYFL